MDTGVLPIPVLPFVVLGAMAAAMAYITDSRDVVLAIFLVCFCHYSFLYMEYFVVHMDVYFCIFLICTLGCLSWIPAVVALCRFLCVVSIACAADIPSVHVIIFFICLVCALGCLSWNPAVVACRRYLCAVSIGCAAESLSGLIRVVDALVVRVGYGSRRTLQNIGILHRFGYAWKISVQAIGKLRWGSFIHVIYQTSVRSYILFCTICITILLMHSIAVCTTTASFPVIRTMTPYSALLFGFLFGLAISAPIAWHMDLVHVYLPIALMGTMVFLPWWTFLHHLCFGCYG